MANPVAIYTPEPAASSRGGVGNSQIIQLDLQRSNGRARFAGAAPPAAARSYAGVFRQAANGSSDETSDPSFEAGRRRAPARVTFAAQQIAQEGLSPGAHFLNYSPALAAYASAAAKGNPNPPRVGQSLEMWA